MRIYVTLPSLRTFIDDPLAMLSFFVVITFACRFACNHVSLLFTYLETLCRRVFVCPLFCSSTLSFCSALRFYPLKIPTHLLQNTENRYKSCLLTTDTEWLEHTVHKLKCSACKHNPFGILTQSVLHTGRLLWAITAKGCCDG